MPDVAPLQLALEALKIKDEPLKTNTIAIPQDYSLKTAKETLKRALDLIEEEEKKIIKRINHLISAEGPFYVSVVPDAEDLPTCVIHLGPKAIREVERECSVGSQVDIEGSTGVVFHISKTEMIAKGKKLLVTSGFKEVTFLFSPQNNGKVLEKMNISYLFPPPPIVKLADDLEYLKLDVELNPIQKQAIGKALNPLYAHPRFVPVPFLIRGPPGTGKTTTLVQLVLQILKHEPNAEIIICTPSNRAADNVIERMPVKEIGKILRFLSFSEELKLDSIVKVEGVDYSVKFSERYSVVVSTLGLLQRLYDDDGCPLTKPTHLIIDEASMVADTDMILALGLIEPETTFIMFGDDKQLGPVVRVEELRKSYLSLSMFERLLQEPRFEAASVCLLENYRSHPGVVAPFNRLFYGGNLKSKVTKLTFPEIYNQLKLIHSAIVKNIPVVEECPTGVYFFRVAGKSMQGESKSWRNVKEAHKIVRIYDSLIGIGVRPAEIGIITPYWDQVQLIKELIDCNYTAVGSVESFQGQERNIILVSTVRSFNSHGIGFVGDVKRFNVTLSRAKTALIMVGNDRVLKGKKLFREFFNLPGIHFFKK